MKSQHGQHAVLKNGIEHLSWKSVTFSSFSWKGKKSGGLLKLIQIEWDRYAEQNGRVFKTTDELTAFPVAPSIFSWELTVSHS